MPLLSANMISDWRRALVSVLATAYPNADVTSGNRSGVSRVERVTVFSDGYRRESAQTQVANPVMVIRYWPGHSDPSSETPSDPTELEQCSMDLANLLQPLQAALGVPDLWFFTVETITTDEDPNEWGVEARLTGHAKNQAAIA